MKNHFHLLIFITYLISFLLIVPNTFAHILKTSGSVGVVIHIDPDDDPIIGKNSAIYFEFKDRENKFKPENCLCTIAILKAGTEIYRQPLFSNNTDSSLTNASLYFTFPEKNIYTVKVEGKALDDSAFTPFTFSYDFRVTREEKTIDATNTTKSWISTHMIHLVVASIILLFVLVMGIRFKMLENSQKNVL